MRSHARAVVIGGGVVGASVLYHLAKLGWREVVLLERSELTSGSTWHAAGGMHTLNGNTNLAGLQRYTVRLYRQLEEESGQSCGIHRVGCLYLASTPERVDFLRSERARARYLGIDLEFVSLEEVRELNPLVDASRFTGALFDPDDGHIDPSGVTQAYAAAARAAGAEIHRHTPVIETRAEADGGWTVVTPGGSIRARVVINAAGLWAREVAALAGLELPVVPMEHQYLVTDAIPEVRALEREVPMTIDFEGESYSRIEGRGLLLGTYEHDCRHWAVDGTPADFGHELIAPDLDRMADKLEIAMQRIPCLREAGIRRVINGGMVFAPDGNPVIGPVRGLRNYWLACGVMAGFSQGGGVGLALAEWIVHGEPGVDVFGMDVARFGEWANRAYTLEKTRENYRRRFAIGFPNEELEAARPWRTTPVYDRLRAAGAVYGAAAALEVPLWFAPPGVAAAETPSYRRSNAFGPVGEECRALRGGAGLLEISAYAKYEVGGPEAAAWLEGLLANRVPGCDGRISLSPMLSGQGRVIGDFTVTRLDAQRFFLVGSGRAESFHLRWLEQHLPPRGVRLESLTARLTGFSVAGPRARELLGRLCGADLSNAAFPFLHAREMLIGPARALVMRLSFTGELGYEIYVAPAWQVALHDALLRAGGALGLRNVGLRALDSLRIEKGYGSWGREYTPDYTPREAGLERLVRLDKEAFIGREAALRDRDAAPRRRLVTLVIDADDADAWGDEPVFHGEEVVGRVTSGAYGHTVGASLALAYVRADLGPGSDGLAVEILGARRPARLAPEPPYDPAGERLRS